MSTTLPHGIIQINEGNISWYGDITANWQLIDGKIGIYDAAIATIPAPANTGTLTINYGGTTIAMFGADDAGNVTADIPAPGDGTLTIQKNGTTVDTFTANSSTDKTVNIQCVDLTNNQTVGGNKEFTGTTTTHDVVPSATDTYNLGSPSYQWNNAYIKSLTINGVAAGDILTHNASEFVDVSSNQTVGGKKTFREYVIFNPYRVQIKNSSQEIGVVPASNQWNGIAFTDKNNSNTFSIEQAFFSNGNTILHFSMTPNIAGGSLLRIFESTYNASTADIETKSRTLIPDANNSRNLGSSSARWKDVNTVLLNGKTPAYSTDIPTKVSQLTNDSGFITSENALPVGSYIQFAGSQAPDGFLVCNGGEISRTTYSALFAVIGTTYGSGDGSTTFNLPNLTDRFLQGSTSVGTVKNAGLPNIQGNIGAFTKIGGNVKSGAFGPAFIPVQGAAVQATSSSDINCGSVGLDASLSNSIYGNSTTVQPPALTCLICIKY